MRVTKEYVITALTDDGRIILCMWDSLALSPDIFGCGDDYAQLPHQRMRFDRFLEVFNA